MSLLPVTSVFSFVLIVVVIACTVAILAAAVRVATSVCGSADPPVWFVKVMVGAVLLGSAAGLANYLVAP